MTTQPPSAANAPIGGVTEHWDELYRTANDAFSALSTQVDATDPAQLAALEEAHARLLEGLRRVRVRGNKKFVD